MTEKKKLSTKQQAKAIVGVASLSFKTAPSAVSFKLFGAVINAVLPIVTTYYAALTTTALVGAYAGKAGADRAALEYVIITAVLGLVMTIWHSLDNYVQAKMRYMVEARVSDQMYERFLSLDFWRYDDKDTADMYDRAMQFSNFFAYVFDRLADIVSNLISMVTAILALAVFMPWLAVAVFVALTPGVFIQFGLSRKQIAHWNENVDVRRARSLLEWHLNQPRGIAELRLYGMVKFMLSHRRILRDTDEKNRIEFERKYIPARLATDALEAVTEFGALVWVTLQIIARAQPVGQFIYVQQIVSRAMTSASSFVSTLGNIDEDIANLFDYEQFMALPAGITGDKVLTEAPKSITINHVAFHYPNSNTKVLDDISIVIEAGQRIALVGENGAGKSTLIKLLTGLYQPSEGSILLDDTPLQEYSIASWHRQLGVLQQDFIYYNFATAGDNVRFGMVDSEHTASRLDAALKQAEAKDFVAKLPRDVDTYVDPWMEDAKGNKGVNLSGGQWQRLALARDFYRNAPIIILDEPTSAIDAAAEARIFNRLFALHDRTVIAISHRLSTVKKADIVYMLKDGKVIETGTYADLLAAKGPFYKMFEAQITD